MDVLELNQQLHILSTDSQQVLDIFLKMSINVNFQILNGFKLYKSCLFSLFSLKKSVTSSVQLKIHLSSSSLSK